MREFWWNRAFNRIIALSHPQLSWASLNSVNRKILFCSTHNLHVPKSYKLGITTPAVASFYVLQLFDCQVGLGPCFDRLVRLESGMIVDRVPQSLLAAELTLCGLDTHVPQEKLDLLEFSSGLMAQPSTRAPEIMWRDLGEAALRARLLYNSPYYFRTEPFVGIRPALLIPWKIGPLQILAADSQDCRASPTHLGIGTVRICRPFPTRSAKTQCPSRCCRSWTDKAASSARRRPQPRRTATNAESRFPRKQPRSKTRRRSLPHWAVSAYVCF